MIGQELSLTFVGSEHGEKTFWMSKIQEVIDALHGGVRFTSFAFVAHFSLLKTIELSSSASTRPQALTRAISSARIGVGRPTMSDGAGYNVQVVGTETRVAGKEYTVYIVGVVDHVTGREFKIFRRFSDFDDLQSKLKKKVSRFVELSPNTDTM